MLQDQDWIPPFISAAIAAITTAVGVIWHHGNRITKVESKADQALEAGKAAAEKSAENGERIARVESKLDAVNGGVDRLDGKIDQIILSLSGKD